MMKTVINTILFIFFPVLLFSCSENKSHAFEDTLASPGLLHDKAGILNAQEHADISSLLSKHNNKGPTIFILTILELPDAVSIERYATEFINSLGFVDIRKRDRILLLIAVKDRKLKIETSKGVRDLLTDDECAQIINELIMPEFKKERYYNGILAGLLSMINELELSTCNSAGSLGAGFNDCGIEAGKAGMHEQALDWFNKAIAQNPNQSDYFMNRAITYHALHQPQQALDDYGTAIKLAPTNVSAYVNRGNLYDDLGELDRAIDDYHEAIRLNPRDPFPYRNRGLAFARKKEYQRALADASHAIELNSNYTAAYILRSCVYKALERLDDADSDRNKAIELIAKYPPVFLKNVPLEKLLTCPELR